MYIRTVPKLLPQREIFENNRLNVGEQNYLWKQFNWRLINLWAFEDTFCFTFSRDDQTLNEKSNAPSWTFLNNYYLSSKECIPRWLPVAQPHVLWWGRYKSLSLLIWHWAFWAGSVVQPYLVVLPLHCRHHLRLKEQSLSVSHEQICSYLHVQ